MPSLPAAHPFSFWSTNPAERLRPLAPGLSDPGESEPRLGISFGDCLDRAGSLLLAEQILSDTEPARPVREGGQLLKRGRPVPRLPPHAFFVRCRSAPPAAPTRTSRAPESPMRSETSSCRRGSVRRVARTRKGSLWRDGRVSRKGDEPTGGEQSVGDCLTVCRTEEVCGGIGGRDRRTMWRDRTK